MTTPAQAYQALRDVSAASHRKKMPASVAATLVAIAGAESGYRINAVGDVGIQTSTWGPSYGLWQIRTLKADTGRGTARDIAFLKGGLYHQAAAAYDVWTKQGLRAWSTYKSGAYKRFSAQARAKSGAATPAAGATLPGGGKVTHENGNTYITGGSTAGGGGGGLENAGALSTIVSALDPLNWAGSLGGTAAVSAADAVWDRVQPFAITSLFVVGGLALAVVGAAITAQPARQRVQSKVEDAAGDAATIAKVAAVA